MRIIQNLIISNQRIILNKLLIFSFGLSLGFLSKYIESIHCTDEFGDYLNLIGNIGSDIAIWIFISTIIAAWSKTPKEGAINVFLFLAGMLITYYAYSTFLFGFFPKRYFIAWGTFAMISPMCGYIVWYSRGDGWISAFIASLPIGLLFAKGYYFYNTFFIEQGINLLAGTILFLIISRTWKQRLWTLPFILIICAVIRKTNILSYLFGGL